jgi:YfiH family protein
MHTWHWHTWQGIPYLTCSLLESWSHGFFTQRFWPRSPSELTEVLQPNAQVYRVKQVHGNRVLTSSEIEAQQQQAQSSIAFKVSNDDLEPSMPNADGLLTEQINQAVWVCSADCTPVLIGDQQTGQVAAVHAGWRGTIAKIVPQAIARLQVQGSQLSNLRVAMGPAISGGVYQVSAEVAAKVGTTILEPQLLDMSMSSPEPILEALYQLPRPPVLKDPQPGHARLDVRQVNALQLEQLGINLGQIAIAPHCTYQEPEHFFSYRRDNRKQVQWSGIISIRPRESGKTL